MRNVLPIRLELELRASHRNNIRRLVSLTPAVARVLRLEHQLNASLVQDLIAYEISESHPVGARARVRARMRASGELPGLRPGESVFQLVRDFELPQDELARALSGMNLETMY